MLSVTQYLTGRAQLSKWPKATGSGHPGTLTPGSVLDPGT